MGEIHAFSKIKRFISALQFLSLSKIGGPVPEMDAYITMVNYVEIFTKKKESTVSSPSDIYYGHYKAACESKMFVKVNLIFVSIPFKVGLPLSRWTMIVYCMMQKVRKLYATKLIIVQVYEVYSNTMLKHILGRRSMWHSEN